MIVRAFIIVSREQKDLLAIILCVKHNILICYFGGGYLLLWMRPFSSLVSFTLENERFWLHSYVPWRLESRFSFSSGMLVNHRIY